MKLFTFLLLATSLVWADPTMWTGSNRIDNINIQVGVEEEALWTDVEAFPDTQPNANPKTTGVAYSIKTPGGWRFLTKSEHRDPFTQPPDSILVYTNGAAIQANAFEYRSYSTFNVPDSSVLTGGGYDYQILYGFIPPQPIRTNFIAGRVLATGKTNFFLGITRKLETGERYLGWLELVRPQADAYAPFRFGRAALDFLPDRPIRVGQQPEFPKLQPEVTAESVRLSVPAAYRRYLGTWLVMERADSLDEPVTWEPVDFGGTNVVTLPADSASRFYRLRLGP
jgi:hypothetical protein